MASRRTQRTLATVLSVLGHAALVVLLTAGLPQFSRERASIADGNPIETAMVDPNVLLAEMARLEEAEAEELRLQQEEIQRRRDEAAAEQKRLEEIERQREEAERQAELERQQRVREQEEADRAAAAEQLRLEREAEAERVRIAELEAERVRQEALAAAEEEERLRREAEAAEQRRIEEERIAAERAAEEERRRAEAALQRQRDAIAAQVAEQVAAEEADRLARESGALDQWIRAIENRVTARWNQPPNVSSDLDCVLEVTQQPDGTVTAVAVVSCNTNDANIIRSLENAVMSASPLPRRPEGVAYARVIQIRFNPTE